jgi:hypothetical protein
MNVEIEFKQIKLRVGIFFTDPTFEEEQGGVSGQIDIESVKLIDSEIDILDLVWNELEIIKELIAEKL